MNITTDTEKAFYNDSQSLSIVVVVALEQNV